MLPPRQPRVFARLTRWQKRVSFILLPFYLLKLQVTYYKLIVLRKECHMTRKYENLTKQIIAHFLLN